MLCTAYLFLWSHRPLKMEINWSLIDIGSKMKINNTRNANAVSRHHQFSSQLSDISSSGTFSLSKWKVHFLHISSSLDLAIFHNKFNFSHSAVSLFSIQFNLSRHNQWLLTTFTILKTCLLAPNYIASDPAKIILDPEKLDNALAPASN